MTDEESNIEDHIESLKELPPVAVWVNAGFGGPSYPCVVNADSTMTVPDGLVRELGLQGGDELKWSYNEENSVIYLKVVHKPWEPPDWLKD